ncbi:MAG: rod shape-determining protein MreD [Methylococcales bacterium]|nr:rod shape-determining protein MreD [Methylococcales bacterium]
MKMRWNRIMLNDYQNLILTLVLAMCLRVAPFPQVINHLNPDWVLLILIYWSLALPYQQGIVNAWFTGLLTDVLIGGPLGEHALIYVLVIYVCILLHKRLRQFPLFQQMAFIFSCLLVARVMVFWIGSMQGTIQIESILSRESRQIVIRHSSLSFWLSILTGTLVWPFINPVLHFIRHFGKKSLI